MDLGLTGKAAIVGGSSRGIGRAIALALAQEGCSVAICARGRKNSRRRRPRYAPRPAARVLPVVCDMSNADDIQRRRSRRRQTASGGSTCW